MVSSQRPQINKSNLILKTYQIQYQTNNVVGQGRGPGETVQQPRNAAQHAMHYQDGRLDYL